MRKILPLLTALFFFYGCAITNTPVTQRKQLILISHSQELSLGEKSYNDILKKSKLSTNRHQANRVKNIGQKIAAVINNSSYKWEFSLVQKSEKNAFCLPGGKVVVYTGLLDIVENDSQLATVIAHEIAHAIARHGAERISMNLISQSLHTIGNIVINTKYPQHQRAFSIAYGLGSQYGVLLPYSRMQEFEADEIGIHLMHDAGYDIDEALKFWQNMNSSKNSKHVAFLSTHPSTDDRINNIRKIINSIKRQ